MVYRGKLGKGCAECRARKTRCDTAHPSCGQCWRSGRRCSGYRNLDDLRVLEQTSDVVAKLSQRRARKSCRFSDHARATHFERPDSRVAPDVQLRRAFPEPSVVLAATAECVFFAQYVNIGAGFTKTDFGYVSPMYANATTDGMLADIVLALGMLALAKKVKDRAVMLAAAQRYTRALRQTQAALDDSKRVTSDETLTTVSLLALHEFVALGTPYSPTSSIHLDGAVELLRLRGPTQLYSFMGRRMFAHMGFEIVLSCLRSRQTVPSSLLELVREFPQHMLYAEELAGIELMEIAARLCSLLASNQNDDHPDVVATYRSLATIERDLAQWGLHLPPKFHFERVITKLSGPTLLDRYDIYETHLAAAIMNRYRCIRIETNKQMLQYAELHTSALQVASEEVALYQQQAMSCITAMSEDICYSVYYFLDHGSLQVYGKSSDSDLTMYGSTAVISPLYFAANPKRISPTMYQWVLGQIARIAGGTGVMRAGLLEELQSLTV